MTKMLRFAVAAPLALALAACGSNDDAATAVQGEPVAAVPAPAGTEWRETVTVTPQGGYLMGNPEAPIKLVEYGSLTCPACAAFANDGAEKLKNDYVNSGRVSFEFRSMLIHGTMDLVLTRMVSCGSPEAVHPLSDQVWANLQEILTPAQTNAAALDQALQLPEDQRFVAFAQQAGLFDFFASRGVSTDQAKQCLADFPAMEKMAETLQKRSQEDGVTGTPTFFLNGNKLEENRWTAVEGVLQRAGAR